MRKISYIVFGIVYACSVRMSAALEIPGGYVFGEDVNMYEDIHITGSGVIENHGALHGNITIDSGMAVAFQNFGQITSNFTVLGNAMVVQNITSGDDLRAIGNLSGHTVHVDTSIPGGKNILNMADFVNLIAGASSVEVESGAFMVGANIPDNNVVINVNNNTVLYINELPDDLSRPLVKGVVGTPFVETVGLDPMYDVTVNWVGSDLYLSVVRRTDYTEVLEDDNLGDYLQELRNNNSDDRLLSALDGATDRAGMNSLLAKSVRTNPIRLMDVPRSINSFYDSMPIDDVAFGVIARPFYISGGDFYFVGGAANVTGTIAEHTVGTVGFTGGMLKYNGDYDEYNGALYGGNIGVRYMDEDFYLRGFGTVSYAKFNDVYAFDGVRLIRNVNGFGGASVLDAGLVYHVMDELQLVPFIGVRGDWASVLNDTKFDVAARAGINATVDTDMDGNKYKFGARLLGQSDGTFYGGIYTDMMSTADGVGGGASVGILYDDTGFSYKLELNVKFEF